MKKIGKKIGIRGEKELEGVEKGMRERRREERRVGREGRGRWGRGGEEEEKC